jgi:hypothetical protein
MEEKQKSEKTDLVSFSSEAAAAASNSGCLSVNVVNDVEVDQKNS